jgi:hypothetical protein
VVAEFDGSAFVLTPPNPDRRCTPESVAELMLHETANPFLHRESSGTVDLSDVRLERAGERGVRISGARYVHSEPYTVRIEGVARRGHRTVLVAATRDPRLIPRIDDYLANAEQACARKVAGMGIAPDAFQLYKNVYGKNGVLGANERSMPAAGELAVVYDVVGETREVSQAVGAALRSLVLHMDFPDRQCTEGNFALPFSPSELDGGEVFDFVAWHALRVDDPLELFPIEYVTIQGGEGRGR